MDGLGGLPPRDRRTRTIEDAVPRSETRPRYELLSHRRAREGRDERLGHASTRFTMDTYAAETRR